MMESQKVIYTRANFCGLFLTDHYTQQHLCTYCMSNSAENASICINLYTRLMLFNECLEVLGPLE